MKIGFRLLKIAAMYMVAGLVLGLAMGISSDFSLSSVHSHLLLLGWATMAITGFAYILAPACGQSRLAHLHFWGHNVGLPVMMASLALSIYGVKAAEKTIAAGSTVVLISLLFFAINLHRNGGGDRAT